MAKLYIGNKDAKLIYKVRFPFDLGTNNGIILLYYYNYVLKDSNGLYLIPKEVK